VFGLQAESQWTRHLGNRLLLFQLSAHLSAARSEVLPVGYPQHAHWTSLQLSAHLSTAWPEVLPIELVDVLNLQHSLSIYIRVAIQYAGMSEFSQPTLHLLLQTNDLLLIETFEAFSHGFRVDFLAEPRPLQRQTTCLEVPRIRAHDNSFQLTLLSFLTHILPR
jgi:hypothetical protein